MAGLQAPGQLHRCAAFDLRRPHCVCDWPAAGAAPCTGASHVLNELFQHTAANVVLNPKGVVHTCATPRQRSERLESAHWFASCRLCWPPPRLTQPAECRVSNQLATRSCSLGSALMHVLCTDGGRGQPLEVQSAVPLGSCWKLLRNNQRCAPGLSCPTLWSRDLHVMSCMHACLHCIEVGRIHEAASCWWLAASRPCSCKANTGVGADLFRLNYA